MVSKRIEFTEEKLRIYREEAESWQAEHQQAMFCFDLHDILKEAIHYYQLITELELDWRDWSFENPDRFDAEIEKRIRSLFEMWHATSKNMSSLLGDLEGQYRERGFDSNLMLEFRRCLQNAESVLADQHSYFVSDAMVNLRDAAIDDLKQGNTCEMKAFGD